MEPSVGLTALIILGILIWAALLFVVAVVMWKDPSRQRTPRDSDSRRRRGEDARPR